MIDWLQLKMADGLFCCGLFYFQRDGQNEYVKAASLSFEKQEGSE